MSSILCICLPCSAVADWLHGCLARRHPLSAPIIAVNVMGQRVSMVLMVALAQPGAPM